ncbi:non-specific serine/threonine protein kinase [Malassezia caprae]|uniref:Non-specific serine/threonine protein kinase n=1 Tax=Malassezia caprae TaxID=1381934 RepID=A0AAF0IW98_9BASI|nr:non-specific serine/threonine protein kinase [Malassezia caprae]
MANPLQRRKSRSSKYSGATKSAKRAQNKRIKRAPTVMGPDVLRDNWDPKLTVRQNYAKLGLVPNLGQQTGGLDRDDPYRQVPDAEPAAAAESKPKKGMARVIRDKDGKVVDIVEYESEDDDAMSTPWGKELNKESETPDLKLLVPRLYEGNEGETVKDIRWDHSSQVIETEAAAYLVRQWLACSLYDRISTRPFITEMEKLWISYQLLYALHAAHERNIAHGDLKCENVLVTSSLAVYVTDFASSFKPTFLPLDDPTDFSLFFDTSGRRTCNIAPERFYDSVSELPMGSNPARGRTKDVENVSDVLTYEPYLEMLGLGRPNGRITEAMDVFSLGCVLAELWRDGAPLFTLSQLFRYRRGNLDLDGILSEIQHAGIRNLVRRMVHLDPAQRPRLDDILNQEQRDLFPPFFSSFFHLYMVDLERATQLQKRDAVRSEAKNLERDMKMNHLTRQVKADDRIEKMYDDWAMIVQFFHQAHNLPGEDVFLGVYIPGLSLRPYMARKSAGKDTKATIVLSLLLANIHFLQAF